MPSSAEIREVKSAFRLLGIEPTVDRNKVKQAFKESAMEWHPDRFQDESDKKRAHHEFIQLTEARDCIFRAIEDSKLLSHLSSKTSGPVSEQKNSKSSSNYQRGYKRNSDSSSSSQKSKTETKEKKTAYEEEWKVFVEDENAYFDLMSSTSVTFKMILQTFGVSLSVSVGMTAMVALVIIMASVVGLGVAAVTSAAITIPILGWFALAGILGWAFEKAGEVKDWIGKLIDDSAEKMLACVSRTGYPTRGFRIATFCSLGITLASNVLIFATGSNTLGTILLLLLLIMGGSLLAVNERIAQRLRRMDEAFADIRATESYALVVASSEAA